MANFNCPIIGTHRSPLIEKFGAPRQSGLVNLPSHIVLAKPYDDPLAWVGIGGFSHLWVIWQCHKVHGDFRPSVRPPRLGGNARIGVFATRSMFRPSNMALSVVQLVRFDNGVLHIRGADFIDGTPILDIKPYIAYSDSHATANSGFAPTAPMPKAVHWHANAQILAHNLVDTQILRQDDLTYIEALIAQDPRPAYQNHTKSYHLCYGRVQVDFIASGDGFLISDIAMRSMKQ